MSWEGCGRAARVANRARPFTQPALHASSPAERSPEPLSLTFAARTGSLPCGIRSGVKMQRRHFLRLAGGAAILPGLSRVALADTYPSRPVRIIAGFAAGGG